jgi:hypothetical protein
LLGADRGQGEQRGGEELQGARPWVSRLLTLSVCSRDAASSKIPSTTASSCPSKKCASSGSARRTKRGTSSRRAPFTSSLTPPTLAVFAGLRPTTLVHMRTHTTHTTHTHTTQHTHTTHTPGVFPRNPHRFAAEMAKRLGANPAMMFRLKYSVTGPLSVYPRLHCGFVFRSRCPYDSLAGKKRPIPICSPCTVIDALMW